MNVRDRFVTVLIAGLLLTGCSTDQATFNSPDAAAESLAGALRKNDSAALKKVFGPESSEILSSGDPVADKAEAARFIEAYDQSHRLELQGGVEHVLIVGKQNWPFPVPIVQNDNGKYLFDTEAGKDEILNRRIGRNELDSVQVCLAIVDAEREYVALRPMGGDVPIYASKLVSSAGKKDGLYWPAVEGGPESPLGELVAEAAAEGYRQRKEGEAPKPYHGYRYRLLTSQGPAAKGGAMDYIVKGQLIGGFAVIAYPAQYGNSGIMSFITNHDGVVYQRDLGPETEKVAQALASFDPTPQWTPVKDAVQDSAGGASAGAGASEGK